MPTDGSDAASSAEHDASGSTERIDGGRTLTRLATDSASSLAVSKSYLYYSSALEGLMKVRVTGGAPITLLGSPGVSGVVPGVFPVIAVDATHVYGAVPTTNSPGAVLVRVPVDGGASEMLAELPLDPFGIAVDGASVYATLGQGTEGPMLVSVPLAGGPVKTLATLSCTSGFYNQGPGGMVCRSVLSRPALSADGVYFTADGTLVRVLLRGGAPFYFGAPGIYAASGDVALFGPTVYWMAARISTFRQMPYVQGGDIWKMNPDVDSGSGVNIATWDASEGGSLAADEGAVYWVNTETSTSDTSSYPVQTGRIMKVGAPPDSPEVVTAMGVGISITALAVDPTSLYYATADTDAGQHRPSMIAKLTPK
jgi:hypothetical protein